MFQMVVVANNGRYGGSNAYAPYKEPHLKQVFHLHGQPQATVAFLEINDIKAFLNRRKNAIFQNTEKSENTLIAPSWKSPPDGIE